MSLFFALYRLIWLMFESSIVSVYHDLWTIHDIVLVNISFSLNQLKGRSRSLSKRILQSSSRYAHQVQKKFSSSTSSESSSFHPITYVVILWRIYVLRQQNHYISICIWSLIKQLNDPTFLMKILILLRVSPIRVSLPVLLMKIMSWLFDNYRDDTCIVLLYDTFTSTETSVSPRRRFLCS